MKFKKKGKIYWIKNVKNMKKLLNKIKIILIIISKVKKMIIPKEKSKKGNLLLLVIIHFFYFLFLIIFIQKLHNLKNLDINIIYF